jgi:hypothetical protein
MKNINWKSKTSALLVVLAGLLSTQGRADGNPPYLIIRCLCTYQTNDSRTLWKQVEGKLDFSTWPWEQPIDTTFDIDGVKAILKLFINSETRDMSTSSQLEMLSGGVRSIAGMHHFYTGGESKWSVSGNQLSVPTVTSGVRIVQMGVSCHADTK